MLRQPLSSGDNVRIDGYEDKVVVLASRARVLMTNAAAEPVQRLSIERGVETQLPDDEKGADRDTSVDHALDDQIGEARREETACDLLNHANDGGQHKP